MEIKLPKAKRLLLHFMTKTGKNAKGSATGTGIKIKQEEP